MTGISTRTISPVASVYLDAARLLAALVVLYVHAHDQWFSVESALLKSLSHGAVVIFFVLSGYVIAYTTTSNNRGELQYAAARLSRLSSVLFPTILITLIINCVVARIDPILMAHYSRGESWPRYILCSTFLNEVWFLSATPPINRPLWSLSYEFWYYAIFGFWFYRKEGYKALLPVAVVCLIAGPKILFMLPVWLAGVAAYAYPAPKLSPIGVFVIVLSLFGAVVIAAVNLPSLPYSLGQSPFFYSNQFLTDWVVGLLFALTLWFLPANSKSASAKPARWIKSFRNVADLTFPIYVLHHPLLILWRAVFGYQIGNTPAMWLAIAAVLLVASILGSLIDKQRFLWVQLFSYLLTKGKAILTNLSASQHPTEVLINASGENFTMYDKPEES